MKRRLKQAAIIIVVVFAVAQLIRPDRTNPTTDASRSIQGHVEATSELIPVLNRACGDCHSNETVWPWYTEVAPTSWLMAYAVSEGRKAVNFSEWAAYSPAQQQMLLIESCRDASSGKMSSGIYTTLRPEARLSARDVETICAASRQVSAAEASQ
jgi:hypothetical protein